MSGIKSVKPLRRFITRVLATALLLAVYSIGALSVSGIASIAGASMAFAQRDYRGRGRGTTRSSSSRSIGRSTSSGGTGRRGAGRGFNKGTSMGVGDSASSGNVRGVGSRPSINKGSSIGVGDSASSGDVRGVGSSFGGGRGQESRGGGTSGRENVETARGGNLDTRRGGSASKTSDETKREIEYCAQQFRSYDRETMTYTDYDGRRRSCP
jgi:hypothetical protein